ncbi:hypothetical protein IMZ48_29130 [Candidatus Bathyarchaeota archaeon]|nr:hypothetical protein [Candidatus Bathyarchaeota archaeon]
MSEPLYPAYLPTRSDGYAAPINVAPFEGDEPGLRADPSKPSLLKAGVSVIDVTPRIGTEIRGVQISELDNTGLDEVALLAAERGVLVFVSVLSIGLTRIDRLTYDCSQRDQDFANIGFDRQREIVRHYGPLHLHPTMGYPEGTGPEFQVVYADEKAYVVR